MATHHTDTELVNRFRSFLRQYYRDDIGELAQKYPHEQRSLRVEWRDLYRFDQDLADDYVDNFEVVREAADVALQQFDLPVDVDLSGARTRVRLPDDSPQTFSVGETRSEHRGEYLAVRGQVTKRSKVRSKARSIAYECQRCGTIVEEPQHGSTQRDPHQCPGCERQGPFAINWDRSSFVDHQLIRLQQPPEEAHGQGTHIDVPVERDLVGEVEAGDRAAISGVLHFEQTSSEAPVFDSYLQGQDIRVEDTDFEQIDIGDHEDTIEALASGERGNPYDLLVDSLAPKIRGHAEKKLAIMLQLFGGVPVVYPTGERERGESHILLLGDPGTAKSSLLRAVNDIAPRASYASGKGSTAAGLTAAAVPDDFGDTKWSLEAGALVRAHKGVACIDEIDKIPEEVVSSMHPAMADQVIDVHKAGINATLPCQTAVLAAGNPKYGRFDDYERLGDQVSLGPTLLSRFDLIFLLQDDVERNADEAVADHMIESRQLGVRYTDDPHTLSESDRETVEPAIEPDVLRAYIAHAKRTCFPRFRDEDARVALKNTFMTLRLANEEQKDAPVPVTRRKLHALQRLAEASARVRLSETITESDVQRARELVMTSLKKVGVDPESGDMDADMIETGMSTSQRDRIKTVRSIVDELDREHDEGAPLEEIVERAGSQGIDQEKVEKELSKLSRQGDIFEPASNHYRTI